MADIKVSVIVPVYNSEKYLKKCLDSLIEQTLSGVEIIAVDDGSIDDSGLILDEYKQAYPDRMQVLHKENGGQASARNLAFGMCKGEYIGFLDSDDFVKSDMFEKMYNKATENDADYVACGYTDIVYEDGKEVILQEYVASKLATSTRDLFFGALVCPFLHIYRKSIIIENEIFFPEDLIYEDTAFYLNLIPYINKIAVIEEALAFRVRHGNSTTTTFKKEKVANIFPVIENSISFYQTNGFYNTYKMELEYFCVKVLYCSSMRRIASIEKFSDARELQKETLHFVKKYFPDYKDNKYFRNKCEGVYIQVINRATAPVILLGLRLMNLFRRTYT